MKSSEYEKVYISHFYKLYQKANIRHRINTYDKTSKRVGRKVLPLSVFKAIIFTYLNIYFFDFYSKNAPSYFPLGGYLQKVISNKAVRDTKRQGKEKRIVKNRTISWLWFLRPNMRMAYMVTLGKMTGSTNVIPKIEQWYKKNYDIDKLPTFNEVSKKKKLNKTKVR